MTGLEQQLLDALTQLSEQFEQEQKRQATLIRTLSKQIQHLSEQIAH